MIFLICGEDFRYYLWNKFQTELCLLQGNLLFGIFLYKLKTRKWGNYNNNKNKKQRQN